MILCLKKSNENNSPTERYRHTSNIFNGVMYVFGGKDNEDEEDLQPNFDPEKEILIYNFKEQNWSEEITKGEDIPKQRAGHTAVIYKNYLYIFGGIFTNFFPLMEMTYQKPELYRYNFLSKMWEYVNYNGEILQLFGHSAIVYEDEMIIYGGGTDTGFEEEGQSNLIFSFEFENDFFKTIKPKNDLITKREGHCSVLYKNSMIIFGGRSKDSRFNDLFKFQLSKGENQYYWTKIKTNGKNPSKRAGCSCIEWKDKLYIFGGFDGKYEMNELWTFDFKTNFWRECIILNDIPNKIGLHSCVKIDNNQELKFYIFGGVSGDQIEDEYFNDFYEMIDSFGDLKINLLNSIIDENYTDLIINI